MSFNFIYWQQIQFLSNDLGFNLAITVESPIDHSYKVKPVYDGMICTIFLDRFK